MRELENILERAFTLCENNLIHAPDLQLSNNTPPTLHTAPTQPKPPLKDAPLEDYLGSLEKEAITNALEKTRWNKTAAAKELGITFHALRYRLKKLGLDD